MTIAIPRLDVMVAYSCNLSCRGCISISDRLRDGIEPYDQLERSIKHWAKLIAPDVTTVFGGEPLLHPRLFDIIQLLRDAWPTTTIRLITNGYLLPRRDPASWFNFGAFEMQVSLHRLEDKSILQKAVKEIVKCQHPWTVAAFDTTDHRQISWQYNNFKIYFSVFKEFIVPYREEGAAIVPWYSDPIKAHKICGAPNTPVLHRGKLYKCPAVANAIELSKVNWFDYSAVKDAVGLEEFVANIGRPESVCGQCPERSQAVIIDHFDIKNVSVR